MKIGIDTTKLPTTVFIERLITGLYNQGNQVMVFGTVLGNYQKIPKVHYVGFKLYSVLNYSKIFQYLKYAALLFFLRNKDKRKLDAFIKQKSKKKWHDKTIFYPILWHKPDVMHIQWVKGIYKYEWLKLFNIKWVISLRGTQVNVSPIIHETIKQEYFTWFKQVDGIHAVSDSLANEAKFYGGEENKIHTIHTGLQLKEFPFVELTNWPKSNKVPLQIVSVGRNNWVKGFNYGIDAMSILKERGISFQYKIIGPGNSEDLLFQIHQLDLSDCISIESWANEGYLKKSISQSDILLIPSVTEGISNVAVEAMALGTPVLSTNCGGMKELIENRISGFMIPKRNSKAISNTIEHMYLMHLDEMRRIVVQARNRIEEDFDLDEMINEYTAFYKKINSSIV